MNQPKSIIGLDIGTSSIKMVQFTVIRGELSLVKARLKKIELLDSLENYHQRRQEDKEKAFKEATVACLREVVHGLDLKRANVISVVNCSGSLTRKLVLPEMPRAEMTEAVKWDVKDYIPFPVDEAVIDYEIFGEVEEEGIKKKEVLAAACPKGSIVEHLDILSQVMIKRAAVIQVPLALRNLTGKAGFKQGESVALIEIGANFAELCILKDGAIEFSRRLPVAGEDITKAMTGVLVSDLGRLEFEINEVERLKKKYGIPEESRNQPHLPAGRMVGEKVSAAQILSLIRPSIEKLSDEIGRSFDYYRGSAQGGNVDRAILLGGSAGLKGLTEYLSDKLRMEVSVGDPLKWVNVLSGAVDKKEIVPHRLGVAIGAALGTADGINLLPIEVKEETRRLIERAGIKAIATAVILLLLFLYIGMRLQLANYNKRIFSGKVELLSLEPQIKEARKQLQINRILIHEPYWIEPIKEISNAAPPNIYITEINMQEGREGVKEVTLCGIILAGEEATLASLSRLMLTLERGIFKNIVLVTTRKHEEIEGSSIFKLKGEIDYIK